MSSILKSGRIVIKLSAEEMIRLLTLSVFILMANVPFTLSSECPSFNFADPFIGSGGPAYGYGGLNPG